MSVKRLGFSDEAFGYSGIILNEAIGIGISGYDIYRPSGFI